MPGVGAATDFSPDDVTEYTPDHVNDTTETPDYNAGTCLRTYFAVSVFLTSQLLTVLNLNIIPRLSQRS